MAAYGVAVPQAAHAHAPDGLAQRPSLSPDVDWDCGHCRNVNRAFRTECNKCGRPKPETKRSPVQLPAAGGHPNIGGRVSWLISAASSCRLLRKQTSARHCPVCIRTNLETGGLIWRFHLDGMNAEHMLVQSKSCSDMCSTLLTGMLLIESHELSTYD